MSGPSPVLTSIATSDAGMSGLTGPKYVYDFAEGSRDMRELLGGKGANVAEMTRVLGADRVPAGFTITTEACVAYMRAGASRPTGWRSRSTTALERLEAARRQAVRRRRGPAARLGPLRRARVDAGDAGHGPEPGAERRVGARAGARDRQRALRLGLLPAPRADVRQRRRGVPGERFEDGDRRGQARARRRGSTPSSTSRTALSWQRFKALYKRRLRGLPAGPAGAAAARDPRRVRLLDWASARSPTGGSTGSPTTGARRSTSSRWCSATRASTSGSGVAFSRDEVTGAPEPSGDFLINAQGEDVVSGVRTPRDLAELAELMPEAHEQLIEILRTLERHYSDMQDTEFTVEEGRLYMLQTRNAKRPAQAAVRFAVDAVEEGLLDARPRRSRRSTPPRSTRCCTRRSTPTPSYEVLARGVAASPGAAKGAIVFTAPDAVDGAADGQRRDPRAARSPRPTTSPASTPRRGSSPPRAARPRTRRSSRAAWAARRSRGAARSTIDLDAGEVRDRRARAARGRPDRDRRHAPGRSRTDDVPLVERRDRRATSRRCSGGPTSCARSACAPTPTPRRTPRRARELRRRGHRPVPDRAHVHGRGPPAEDARDDHGRRPRRRRRRRSTSCCRSSRRTSRGCSRRWRACR